MPSAYEGTDIISYLRSRYTGEDGEDAFYKASDLLLHEFRKMSSEFVSVGLVKITFPVEEIFTVELSR